VLCRAAMAGAGVGGRGGVHWHERRRPLALVLVWEAAAREGQQRESRVGLGFPLRGLQTPSQKAMTPCIW